MTVSAQTTRFESAGDGTTVDFSFNCKFYSDSDIKVVARNTTTLVETPSTLNVGHTIVSKVSDGNGGYTSATVRMGSAPATGNSLVRYLDPALTQEMNLVSETNKELAINRKADLIELKLQRADDRMDRAVRLSDGQGATFDPTLPNGPAANYALVVNGDGDGFSWGAGLASGVVSSALQSVVNASTLAGGAARLLTGLRIFHVEDPAYGAVGDGVTDDSAAFDAAVAAAVAAGGGIITGSPGKIYAISSDVDVTSSNIVFDMRGATLKAIGSASTLNMLDFRGALSGSPTTLGASSALWAQTLQLTSATGYAVGDFAYIRKTDAVNTSVVNSLISELTAVSAPNITLREPVPFDIDTADTESVQEFSPISRCGVCNVRFDFSAFSGTIVRGAYFLYCAESFAEHVSASGAGIAIDFTIGVGNRATDIRTDGCGINGQSQNDFIFAEQTGGHVARIRSYACTYFGPDVVWGSYNFAQDIASHGATGRALKFQGERCGRFIGVVATDSTLTGISIAEGTSYCTFVNLVGLNCGTTSSHVGVWVNGSQTDFNKITNVVSLNNGDGTLDILDYGENNRWANVEVTSLKRIDTNAATTCTFVNVNEASAFGDDSGATVGPVSREVRYSASPAANDLIAERRFAGFNGASPSEQTDFAGVGGQIITTTDGSEDGALVWSTIRAGTYAARFKLGNGIYYSGGADPGANDINAVDFFSSGTKVVGAQGAAVADASGGATVDAEARTALNALLARLRTHGLIAT